MKPSPETPLGDQPLDEAVRTSRERRARGEREGRRSIGQDLALIGVLGWTIVIPTLFGVFAGRWLDRRFQSGIFWTLGLLVAGVTLGCTLAWQRLRRA
ncbi:MAG TPA: AtpZ/AtpI family protein [Steroidobacteraceae bacterium]|nr:AtpZ/AtpI family protein [Steroidobacteraceae bacterium]